MYDARDGQNIMPQNIKGPVSLHTLHANAHDTIQTSMYKRYSGMVRRSVATTAIFSDSISKYVVIAISKHTFLFFSSFTFHLVV